MTKKKDKKTISNLFMCELVILVVLTSILALAIKPKTSAVALKNHTTFKQVLAHTLSTPSATPTTTPTPKAIPLPLASGKTTNVPILYYHYIGNNPNPTDKARDSLSVSPDKFEEEMKYLSDNGYSTISLDTLYSIMEGKAVIPLKPIVLSFDDGYIDFYVNAFPIMRKYNIHSVSFIPTGLIGGGYYMTWDQIKEINASGLVTFEAHSVHHTDLPTLSKDAITYEVVQSKIVLEQQLGSPVNFFAYPYGASNALSWQAVKNAGFVGAVGTWGGITESEGTIFDWPRLRVPGGATLDQFKRLI